MLYFLGAVFFGIVGAFCAAYWTREHQQLDTDDYMMGAFLIGLFGAGWVITVPLALIIGCGMLLLKVCRKIVRGEIKFTSDV